MHLKKIQSQINKLTDLILQIDQPNLADIENYFENEQTIVNSFQGIFPICAFLQNYKYLKGDLRFKAKFKYSLDLLKLQIKDRASFNYIERTFLKESKRSDLVIPDDADDTMLAIDCFIETETEINEDLILNLLNLESKVGGPYKTWYLLNDATGLWSDVDPIVNANILYVIAKLGIDLPKTKKYIIQKLLTSEFTSKYYKENLIGFYYLAKYAAIKKDRKLRMIILNELEKYEFSNLSRSAKAFYLLAEIELVEDPDQYLVEKVIEFTKDLETKIFYSFDFAKNKEMTFSTSKLYSYSIYLNLLYKLKEKLSKKAAQLASNPLDDFKINIIQDLEREIKNLEIKNFLPRKLYPSEGRNVLDLCFLTASSFKQDLSKENKSNLINFTKLIYYGWCAYTLLDDYIDGESNLDSIVLVNILFREHYFLVNSLFNDGASSLRSNYQVTDSNYLYEIKNLKNKKVENLTYDYVARRMNIFCKLMSRLPSLLLNTMNDEIENNLNDFFINLMLLDQLNDDAHDYKIDIEAKISTPVTVELKSQIDIENSNSKKIDEVFWMKTIKFIYSSAEKLFEKAQMNLKNIEKINRDINIKILSQVLDKSFKPLKDAYAQSESTKRIIDQFK